MTPSEDNGKKQLERSSKRQKNLDRWTARNDYSRSREKVCCTLKQFKDVYERLMQERKTQNGRKMTHRIDMLAANMLKKEDKWVNSDQEVGGVLGVEIGDHFQLRAEMLVIGLHNTLVNGISYIRLFDRCFATSIINSSRYYNNVMVSDTEFEYVGEGGNPKTSKKKAEDQKLTNGNLALKTSMDDKLPVRVIHYMPECGRYVYDGLYLVTSCKKERSLDTGKMVFKFKMIRMPGQPENSFKIGRV